MSVKIQSATDPTLTISKERCVPGSINIPVAIWPPTATTISANPETVAAKVVNDFNSALGSGDTKGIAELFLKDGYWRDHLAVKWDLHTHQGQDNIAAFLADGCPLTKIEVDKSAAFRSPQYGAFDGLGTVRGIQFFVTFTSETGSGQGVARLAEKNGQWKIFTLFTALTQIAGHEETLGHRRAKGVEHGGKIDRKNWQDRRIADTNFENSEPTVLIVGMFLLPLMQRLYRLILTLSRRWSGGLDSCCSLKDAWS